MNRLFLFLLISIPFTIFPQDTPEIEKKYLREIDKLAKNKKVERAFTAIDTQEDETMQNLITLTQVLAPPFKEEARAKVFAEMLRKAGLDSIWTDAVGNVLGIRKGIAGHNGYVGLDAHLDVVFPEGTDVKVRMAGDTLKAPGIGDDTRGLTMLLSVVKALNTANIQTSKDLLIVGSVGEEGLGDLRGMKYLFHESGLPIDSWISIDGGNMGRISNAALGSKRYKVIVRGNGGHSWGDFGLANPHHALGSIINAFSNKAWAYTSKDIPRTSFNVGRIGGGTSVNSIPFESWMEVDMRSESPENLDAIEALLIDTANAAVDTYNKRGVKGVVVLELEKIGDRPSGELSASLPLVQRAMATTSYFGVQPSLGRGSTNINIPVALGIPAVCIGRGGEGGGAHSLHEWFLNTDEGAESIKLALLLTLSETGIN